MSKVIKLVGIKKNFDRTYSIWELSPNGKRKVNVKSNLNKEQAQSMLEGAERFRAKKVSHLKEVRQKLSNLHKELENPIPKYEQIVE